MLPGHIQLKTCLLSALALLPFTIAAGRDFIAPDASTLSQLCNHSRRSESGGADAINLTPGLSIPPPENLQCKAEKQDKHCGICAGPGGTWGQPCAIEPEDCIHALERQLQGKGGTDADLIITANKDFSSTAEPLNGNFQLGMCVKYSEDQKRHKWLSNTGSDTCTFLVKPTAGWYKDKITDEDIHKTRIYRISWEEVYNAVKASSVGRKDSDPGCTQWHFPLYPKDVNTDPAPPQLSSAAKSSSQMLLELHIVRLQKECPK